MIESGVDIALEEYKPLVLKQAKRLSRRCSMPYDDLVAEGHVGLLKAAERFDPTRGASFSTYANYWIRQAMLRALDSFSRTVRLPWQSVAKLKTLEESRRRLSERLGHAPSDAEVSKDSGISHRTMRMLKTSCNSTVSIDAAIGVEDNENFLEFIPDNAPTPSQKLEAKDVKVHFKRALSCLDSREVKVLSLRFGLIDGRKPESCEMVGAKIGLSRESVRKIQESSLLKLRSLLPPELQDVPCVDL